MAKKLSTAALLAAVAIVLASCSAPTPMTASDSCSEYATLLSKVKVGDGAKAREAVRMLGEQVDSLHESVQGPVKEMVSLSASTPDDAAFDEAIFPINMALADACL